MMAYRIGLIGNRAHQNVYGPIWKGHSDCRVVAAAEHHPEKAQKLSEACGLEVVSDYDAVLEDPNVDVVSICTDFYLKRPLIKKAIACGKHILVDKPIGRTVAEAREISEAIAGTNIKLVLAYPMRFVPAMMQLKSEMARDAYGRVVVYAHTSIKHFLGDLMAYVSYPTPAGQNGGGEVMNLGSHAVDCLFWQLGVPERIYCRMQNAYFEEYRAFGTEDIGTLWCDYGDLVAILTVGRTPARHRDGMVDEVCVDGEGVRVRVTRTDYAVNGESIAVQGLSHSGSAGCVQHLIDCIEQDRVPTTGVENGLGVAQMVTAAYQSAQSGQFVSLPLKDERHPLIAPDEQVLDGVLD